MNINESYYMRILGRKWIITIQTFFNIKVGRMNKIKMKYVKNWFKILLVQ
jgi:hypothetical protein